MATAVSTVNRARAVVRRIERLDADPARREAVLLGLVDALRAGDRETLDAALRALRAARAATPLDPDLAGWLDAAIGVAHWSLERLPSEVAVAPGTLAHDFLSALRGEAPLGSAELRRSLDTD